MLHRLLRSEGNIHVFHSSSPPASSSLAALNLCFGFSFSRVESHFLLSLHTVSTGHCFQPEQKFPGGQRHWCPNLSFAFSLSDSHNIQILFHVTFMASSHPGKGLMYVHSHIKAHRNTFSTVFTCCLEIDHQLFLTVGWSLF